MALAVTALLIGTAGLATLQGVAGASGTTATAPHVTWISDDSSPLAGGALVTINGYGFTGATSVSFGTTSVSLTAGDVLSDTAIQVTAPAATTVGPVEVTVKTSAGTSTRNPGDVFTYVAGPILLGASGSVGTADPTASPVTLYGYGLSGTSGVNIGTTALSASSITPVSDQMLSVTPPSLGVGTVPITLTGTASTILSVPVTYDDVPQVDNVQLLPQNNGATSTIFVPEGPLGGGQTFGLSGSGFTGATKVLFGATPASSFQVQSDGFITGTVPASTVPGPVDVTVVGPGGTPSAINANDVWYYDPGGTIGVGTSGANPPAITQVDAASIGLGYYSFGQPVDGPSGPASDSTVTLTGTNFTGTTAVDFGSTPSPSFSVQSDTQLTAVVPTTLTATAAITVTNAAGTSVLTPGANFTPTASPLVTSVTLQGSTATIQGFGLTGATAVDFAGKASTFTVTGDNTITAQVPTGATQGDVTVTTPEGASPVNPMDTFGYYGASTPVMNDMIPALASGSLDFNLYGQLAPFEYLLQGVISSGLPPVAGGLGVGVPSGGDPFTTCVLGPTPTTLLFGSSPATGLSASSPYPCYPGASSSTVSATSPADPGAAPGPMAITASDGTSTSPVLPGSFWYYGPNGAGQAPVVTGIGATQIALSDAGFSGYVPTVPVYGSGFTGTTAVSVGGVSVPLSDVNVVNDDLMLLTLPSDTPTSGSTPDAVSVTTALGTSASTPDDLVTVTPGTSAAAPPPPTSADAADSAVSNTTTGTAAANVGQLSASATGEGGVTVASYAADPETSAPSGSTGTFLDVAVSPNDSFSSLAVTMCHLTSSEALDYYDGSAWVPMAPQSYDATTGCVTATLNDTNSTPLISDLTGTPVAVVSSNSAGGTGGTSGTGSGGTTSGGTGSTGGTGGGGGGTGSVGGTAPTPPVAPTPPASPAPTPSPTPTPRPGPTPLRPVAGLTGGAPKIARGAVSVGITCADASCGGTIVLELHGRTLGERTYTLSQGARAHVSVGLDALAKRLLERTKDDRLAVVERITVNGGASLERTVTLVGAPFALVKLPAARLAVHGRVLVDVPVRCVRATCQGVLRLQQGKVSFAARSYKVAPGKVALLPVRLDRAALLRLARSRGHVIVAVASVKVFGGPTVRRVVRVIG